VEFRIAQSDRTSAIRFLALGGSNTAATLVLFALLERVMAPWIAYSVVFALGLTYTTLLIGRFVFRSTNSSRRSALFIGWYLAVYAVGVSAVQALQALGVRSHNLLAVFTVLLTAPLNFFGGRRIFAERLPTSTKEIAP